MMFLISWWVTSLRFPWSTFWLLFVCLCVLLCAFGVVDIVGAAVGTAFYCPTEAFTPPPHTTPSSHCHPTLPTAVNCWLFPAAPGAMVSHLVSHWHCGVNSIGETQCASTSLSLKSTTGDKPLTTYHAMLCCPVETAAVEAKVQLICSVLIHDFIMDNFQCDRLSTNKKIWQSIHFHLNSFEIGNGVDAGA